jgi:hypothetical protein
VAIKGLLIRIQLSTNFEIILACTSDHLKDFTNYLPALIAAAVRSGTKLKIVENYYSYDKSFVDVIAAKEIENVIDADEITANEIEKAGANIDGLEIKDSLQLY